MLNFLEDIIKSGRLSILVS